MRRVVVLLAVLALLMVALAAPAFAAASGNANCVGQFVSNNNELGALGGPILGSTAPGGVVGQYASSNDCPEE